MSKQTTDQKTEKQTEVKQPVALNDDELVGSLAARIFGPGTIFIMIIMVGLIFRDPMGSRLNSAFQVVMA